MWASGWDWVPEERGKTAAIQPPIVDTYLLYFLLKILMIVNDFSQSPLALLRGSGQRDTAHLTSGRCSCLQQALWGGGAATVGHLVLTWGWGFSALANKMGNFCHNSIKTPRKGFRGSHVVKLTSLCGWHTRGARRPRCLCTPGL